MKHKNFSKRLTLDKKTIVNLKNDVIRKLKGGECSEPVFRFPTDTWTPCPCGTEQDCQSLVGCTQQVDCTDIGC